MRVVSVLSALFLSCFALPVGVPAATPLLAWDSFQNLWPAKSHLDMVRNYLEEGYAHLEKGDFLNAGYEFRWAAHGAEGNLTAVDVFRRFQDALAGQAAAIALARRGQATNPLPAVLAIRGVRPALQPAIDAIDGMEESPRLFKLPEILRRTAANAELAADALLAGKTGEADSLMDQAYAGLAELLALADDLFRHEDDFRALLAEAKRAETERTARQTAVRAASPPR